MNATINTRINFLGFFLKYESYGIDIFYNRKYQDWLISNSTDAEYLDKEESVPQYDNDGFITNIKFTPFEKSIPLTEKDFIQIELKRLSFFDVEKLRPKQLRLLNYYKDFLINKSNNPIKPKKEILEFKDFFNKEVDENTVNKIKEKFKTLKAGSKEMAYFVFILHKELNLIDYLPNDKVKGRKYFIIALIDGDEKTRTSGADWYFNTNNVTLKDGNDHNLKAPSYESEHLFKRIKKQLIDVILPK